MDIMFPVKLTELDELSQNPSPVDYGGMIMAKNDYGFYGNGLSGYVHYKQSFDRTQNSSCKSSTSHSADSHNNKDTSSKETNKSESTGIDLRTSWNIFWFMLFIIGVIIGVITIILNIITSVY